MFSIAAPQWCGAPSSLERMPSALYTYPHASPSHLTPTHPRTYIDYAIRWDVSLVCLTQVDTAGLARAQRELAKSNAAAQSLESSNAETSTTTTATPTEADTAAVSDSQGRISGDGAGGDRDSPQGGAGRPTSSAELQAAGSEDSVIVTGQGERRGARQGQGKEEGDDEGEGDLDPGAIKLEMLPMGAVGHLGRRDQLGIIRKTVAREKRMLVLQRLFHLAQGG